MFDEKLGSLYFTMGTVMKNLLAKTSDPEIAQLTGLSPLQRKGTTTRQKQSG